MNSILKTMQRRPNFSAAKRGHDNLQEVLGKTVRFMRKTGRISQVEFGKLLDVHQTAVCRIEKGSQSLTPEQLSIISKYFSVSVDSLLAGEVNYLRIAEQFGGAPPLPERYRSLAFSKMREPRPLLQFAHEARGNSFARKLLTSIGLEEVLFLNLDLPISVNCNLDMARKLIETGTLTKEMFPRLVEQTRTEASQGFLHKIYSTQENPISLMQAWIINAHHYESNFKYAIEGLNSNAIDLTITPNAHMADVRYKDETLGSFLCDYKKAYFHSFPALIGQAPLTIEEKECHFHGHAKCVYSMKVA